MKGRWTEDQDAFLMLYEAVGVDFVAAHDFGRPAGSGSRRMKKLIESGAAEAYAQSMQHLQQYRLKAGQCRNSFVEEITCEIAEDWREKANRWRAARLTKDAGQ